MSLPFREQSSDQISDQLNAQFSVQFSNQYCDQYCVDECGSTLTTAAELAKAGRLPKWHSVLARTQTGGRGQLGRNWVSPAGNLYATVRLPDSPPFTHTAAAPALGAWLAHALRGLGVPILVKWPNDLVLECPPSDSARLRKVGGILVEERNGVILAGVGLNIASAPADSQLRAESALPAGTLDALALSAKIPSLCGLWAALVQHLRSEFERTPEGWLNSLQPVLAFRNQEVIVRDEAEIRGRLAGVDSTGALRLATPEDEMRLLSGSLQVPGECLV